MARCMVNIREEISRADVAVAEMSGGGSNGNRL